MKWGILFLQRRSEYMEIESNIVDDRGTGQDEARDMLRNLRDNGFHGDNEKAGRALGRHASEVREMVAGDLVIDDDLAMKVLQMANERGIRL